MPYYSFNKCKPECLTEISELANKNGLEFIINENPVLEWVKLTSERLSLISITVYFGNRIKKKKNNKFPLVAQTEPDKNHKTDEPTFGVIKKIIEITGSTFVTDNSKYDNIISEFNKQE